MHKMGKQSSKYKMSKSMEREIVKDLNLKSGKGTKRWYASFIKSYPSGELDENEFVSIYKKFFPQGDVKEFAKHVSDNVQSFRWQRERIDRIQRILQSIHVANFCPFNTRFRSNFRNFIK